MSFLLHRFWCCIVLTKWSPALFTCQQCRISTTKCSISPMKLFETSMYGILVYSGSIYITSFMFPPSVVRGWLYAEALHHRHQLSSSIKIPKHIAFSRNKLAYQPQVCSYHLSVCHPCPPLLWPSSSPCLPGLPSSSGPFPLPRQLAALIPRRLFTSMTPLFV